MKWPSKILLLLILLCVLGTNSLRAQETSKYNDWNFRISPYFWFVNLKGTVYRPPAPSNYPEPPPSYDIDVSFRELSSSIKFAMMASGEYRIKRFSTIFNYASLILEGSAVTPADFVLQNLNLRLDYHSGDISAGYRFILKPKIELDGYLGIKYVFTGIRGSTDFFGSVPFEGERSKFLFEPILGTRVIYKPLDRLDIGVYADVGGFLQEPETSFQFIGTANFAVSKWFVITLGYRYWSIKADINEAVYNGNIQGWITRLGFQF